jgi:cell division septation protein DedD
MTGAAILAIVVATTEINDPATAIMIGAAGEALGPAVAIRLLGADLPDDADLLQIERETGAGAVVTLVWRDATRLRARVRLHVAASGHTTTRELVFSEADTRVERGRTLGLAAASMWPEIRAPAAAPPAPPPPSPHPNQPVPAPAAVPAATVRAAPAPPAAPRFALGLAALAASGDARAVGARVESAFSAGGSWSLRAALSARTGSIPVLADGTFWTFAPGLAFGPTRWPCDSRSAASPRPARPRAGAVFCPRST